ncbi:MAG: hypothetical protein O7D86_03580 [Proteobacteria bacterium]|nr:hypothetical protein [Pseudomonadota bacterium]
MKNFIKFLLLLILCSLFTACLDESNTDNADVKKDHVWKETTDTIDRAKEVEGMIMDAAEKNRKTIEQQAE